MFIECSVARIEMANGKFFAHLRVPTDRQGRSGLGLEAQRDAIMRHLNGGDWQLVGEAVEIESGRKNDRPRPTVSARYTGLVVPSIRPQFL